LIKFIIKFFLLLYKVMELIDFKSIFIIIHVFGAVIGAGGAYLSDAIFISSTRDKTINKTEFRFMKLGSIFVWSGLILLIISGILLFLTDPVGYINSSKFLIKMFIVLAIFINGLFFHIIHFPRIYRHVSHHYPSSDEFMRKKKYLLISGVISITSWTFALILGLLPSIPFTFLQAFVIYVIFELVTIFIAVRFFKKVF
jgi:uncharacterized membrane protein